MVMGRKVIAIVDSANRRGNDVVPLLHPGVDGRDQNALGHPEYGFPSTKIT
jgi:hypothetical protein